tara:strand:+ start:358 stop:708 length:351 start_codon:yes stop_codon:yes gene_type:complete
VIKINVDEGYAFDFLAILKVKAERDKFILESHKDCRYLLASQIGEELFSQVESSEEYKNLIDINELIFEAVEKARKDEVPASYIDNLNYKRFLSKKEIQDKFFDKRQSEIKIGYDK